MFIDEVIRSCSNENVAEAAVASLPHDFSSAVRGLASSSGMTPGSFAVASVGRFVQHGDEAEMRSVVSAMNGAQEPLLAGLQRILAIMIASGKAVRGTRSREPQARLAAQRCTMELTPRRETML